LKGTRRGILWTCVILFLACSTLFSQMDLDRQKAVRAGHRGVITKLTREVDEALTGDAASGEKVGGLNVIYEQLQNN